ncbi:MAG: esterase family protein, partial [candidate division Zixibacteria bacterium]|nr:esterase family protein [candidate division Zixibacteria bacterium]
MYQANIRIFYPDLSGRIVLRTEQDWNRDVEAHTVSDNGEIHEFHITYHLPGLQFKPCIRDGSLFHWSAGANKLLIFRGDVQTYDFYPCFFSGAQGEISGVFEVPSSILNRNQRIRLYLPPGYFENQLKRYPVLYMHDGTNLFFPQESFLGQEWKIDETNDLLSSMNLIDQTIVVGIYAADRFRDYTQPGYESYGRSLVEEIKPWVDENLRTLSGPKHTFVMGSSLGGVVSFYLAWQWPEVFGGAGCLSSTFSYRDDLVDRVRAEESDSRKHLRIYLDSGWPGDNYEVTLH